MRKLFPLRRPILLRFMIPAIHLCNLIAQCYKSLISLLLALLFVRMYVRMRCNSRSLLSPSVADVMLKMRAHFNQTLRPFVLSARLGYTEH